MSGFRVSIGDLNGWATEVVRQSGYFTDIATYGSANLSDTDFGKILEVLTDSYRTMVPQFLAVIGKAGTNLGQEGAALTAAVTRYSHEEARTRAQLDKLVAVAGSPDPTTGGPRHAR